MNDPVPLRTCGSCLSCTFLSILCAFLAVGTCATAEPVPMPRRGICAHRGASDTHPENTLAALREAVRLGAHMLEFDVALTKDGQLVLLHDRTLDRTTDGSGAVTGQTLVELKKLDAGSWKGEKFAGERIPTLAEALSILPENIWLNVHLKGGEELARATAREIVAAGRLHQAFLACSERAARAAREVDSRILFCNMDRQANSLDYVNNTIVMDADFIQLLGGRSVATKHTEKLAAHGIRINYCCANESDLVRGLFESGVEFPLVDRLGAMLVVADTVGIERLRPMYRSRLSRRGLARPLATLVEQRTLDASLASQGVAASADAYFTATARTISRLDHRWKLERQKDIVIEGVNHVGAIDYHGGFLWAGLLHGPEGGKHDPEKNRSIVARIRADTLAIDETWDLTADVTWIDPVCFDGEFLWVGDLSDLGIHRYRLAEGKATREGVLRYPKEMHFSQGIRVVGGKLYTIHTFGAMDGLFEFELPKTLTERVEQPKRVWAVAETRMHLEGFAFVPGSPGQIWHAQGAQVDRYELEGW